MQPKRLISTNFCGVELPWLPNEPSFEGRTCKSGIVNFRPRRRTVDTSKYRQRWRAQQIVGHERREVSMGGGSDPIMAQLACRSRRYPDKSGPSPSLSKGRGEEAPGTDIHFGDA